MPSLVSSVNVMQALIPDVRGSLDLTAIDKRPVAGRVPVARLGLEGDQQYDTAHHGGVEQAVYAYAVEDLRWWSAEIGRDLTPGQFGENLTTEGLDVTGAQIGERWRIGDAGLLVEVSCPRIPCATFQGWMDEPRWVKRFTDGGAPGAYLRVLTEGTVAAGDEVEVVHRPDHGVTIGETLVIRRAASDKLERLLEMPGLNPILEDVARTDLAARAR